MNDLNSVILTGRVTRDVELKYTTSGTAVANFPIAVNEGIKQQDGRYEDTPSFFEITLWGKQAETMTRFLNKGKQITVQGKLRQQSWHAEDGSSRSKVTVNAQFIQLLSSPEGRPQQQGGVQNNASGKYGGSPGNRRTSSHRESQSASAMYGNPVEMCDEGLGPEYFLGDDIPI